MAITHASAGAKAVNNLIDAVSPAVAAAAFIHHVESQHAIPLVLAAFAAAAAPNPQEYGAGGRDGAWGSWWKRRERWWLMYVLFC